MIHLCLLAALSQGAVIPSQPALVEVKHGRARVVREGETKQLTALDPAAVTRGPAHLEVAAGSVVCVSWRGLATVRFEGPTAFEWDVAGTGGELSWRAVDVASMEAEIRRGVAHLSLPLGWRADLETGAYHLSSRSDGGTHVYHSAGNDLRLSWRGDSGPTRPPTFLAAGQAVHLYGPPVAAGPPDLTAAAPAWGRYVWPWGVDGIPGRPDLGAGPAWREPAWPFGPSPQEDHEPWDAPEWPWEAPETSMELLVTPNASQPENAAEGDSDAGPGPPSEQAGSSTEPEGHRTSESTASAESAPISRNTESELPRPPAEVSLPFPALESASAGEPEAVPVAGMETGTPPSAETPETADTPRTTEAQRTADEAAEPQVQSTGPLRHMPHPELIFTELPEGRWSASLPEKAEGAAQILGQRFDTWIEPGGLITVDAKGSLIYHLGPVEMRPSGR